MKLYRTYNGFNNRLLEPDPIIEAQTSREAAEILLKKIGISYTAIKRTARLDVKIMTQPIKIENGQKYIIGQAIWWEVI